MASSPRFLIASSAGIAMSSAFAGVCLTVSYMSLPSLLLSSPPPLANAPKTRSTTSGSLSKPATNSGHLARQWQKMYDIGKVVGPIVAAFGGGSFIYAALELPRSLVVQRRLCFAAAVLAVIIGPFTIAIMSKTNAELNRRADLFKQGAGEDEETREKRGNAMQRLTTHDLINHWGNMNAMRAVFPLIGVTAAVMAMVM